MNPGYSFIFNYITFIGISLGVGKSSLAATLSMVLANQGKKVLEM